MIKEIIDSEELLYEKIKLYNQSSNLQNIKAAFSFAEQMHAEQKRLSGEPYVSHPLNVAYTIADLHLDDESIIAALLHDVVEDTPATYDDLRERFGRDVESLVKGVTKISSIKEKTKEFNQAINIRKILMASFNDVRVIIIKLADKLHNMRTLEFQREDKQKRIAEEVLDIYAPLAARLGMFQIKSELEDLAFKFYNPQIYKKIAYELAEKKGERDQYVENITELLRVKLDEIGIQADVKGRAKHLYSIYTKMKRDGKELKQIYDLHGLRIITEKVSDCYGVLGIVHTMWNPLPGRFKDYIAMPKPNQYQSIHTTVWGPGMMPLEVQIRTEQMHRIAEDGIAAHWHYKEKGAKKKFAWVEKVQRWHSDELESTKNFLRQIKSDLASKEIYVFSPKGEIIELPQGSTPIDYAYHIHTEIGNHCSGAKVNGKMVNLYYQLKQGDQVDILTSKNTEPNASWLKFCRTSHARTKIRLYIRKKEEKLLSRPPDKDNKEDGSATSIVQQDIPDIIKIKKVKKENRPTHAKGKTGQLNVEVMGHHDLLIRFANCCHPVVGDAIVGYISRGRGITIHKKDCHNVVHGYLEKERLINVLWESQGETYPVTLNIVGADRRYFLRDLVTEISNSKINIVSADAKKIKGNDAKIIFTLAITHTEELKGLVSDLKKVKGVRRVYRS